MNMSQYESKASLNSNSLASLRPIYQEQLLCIGGRISLASLPHEKKHQIILT